MLSGESRNLVTIRWNTGLSTGVPVTRGTYGYYEVRSNAVHPEQGFITEGNIHTNNIGLFIQDAWTIGSRLTVNAGIRTEREEVPTYSTGTDIPEFGIKFGFGDKFAPRVGAAYDITGDGRTKVFASWGVFYDIFKLELPRGSFGGDKWLSYYYTLDTFDWPNLVTSANCPPACPGTIIRGAPTAANPIGGIDFRAVSLASDSLDPGLKPMRQQEATAGIERQIGQRLSASVRYVHKQLDRAVDDTGFLQPDGSEGYVIANPGEGLTELAFTNPVTALPKAKRNYDSVEFAIEKRFADNWYVRSSYLWSRLYGNYTGLSQSDENGRTAPNVGRAYDYPMMMFQDGGSAAFGPLPTDRPHQFKTQFIYQFKTGTSLGLNEYVASGLPVSREIGIFPTSNYPVQYLGRGSDGRTPTYSQTDLLVQQNVHLTGTKMFQVYMNVLNLFNQDTVVNRFVTYQKVNGVTPNENLFYTGAADARVADHFAEHRQGSALPDGQRVSAPDRRAHRREVPLLIRKAIRSRSSTPRASARGVFYWRARWRVSFRAVAIRPLLVGKGVRGAEANTREAVGSDPGRLTARGTRAPARGEDRTRQAPPIRPPRAEYRRGERRCTAAPCIGYGRRMTVRT